VGKVLLEDYCKAVKTIYVPVGIMLKNSPFARVVYLCVLYVTEKQTAIIFLYSVNWLVFVTETDCVYCAVRTE